MLTSLGLFLLGLFLLLLGTDTLLRSLSGLAARAGLSAAANGFLAVALVASLPDLAVGLAAGAQGQVPLAAGHALGQGIGQVGLLLALLCLGRTLPAMEPWLPAGVAWGLAGAAALALLGLDGRLDRLDGVVLLVGAALAVANLRHRLHRAPQPMQDALAAFAESRPGVARNLLRLALAAGLLGFGVRYVVGGAPVLGAALGLDGYASGLLLLGLATTLPDLALARIAIWRGQAALVPGLALSALVFNLWAVFGAMALWQSDPLPGLLTALDLPAAVALLLVVFPFLKDGRLQAREGRVLLALFGLWLAWAGWRSLAG